MSDFEALKTGNQLLSTVYLGSFQDSLWTLGSYQDAGFRFVGYPSTDGNNNVFSLTSGLCISATCADPDAAWQFVRRLFTEEYQQSRNSYGFSVNANVFEQQRQEAMTIEYMTDENGDFLLDENGEKIINYKATVWLGDENFLEIPCMTQEQADQIMDLYESIHTISSYDKEIYDIVETEAAGYFAGQTALDEIVKRIQNRVSLYVAERK